MHKIGFVVVLLRGYLYVVSFFVVRLKGLEPTRIAAREPKGDVTLVKCSQMA